MRVWLRDRLILRVVIHGVLLLVVTAFGSFTIAVALFGPRMDSDMNTFTSWFGEQACEQVARSPQAREDIARFPAPTSVYTLDGTPLARSLHEPPGPLSPEQLALLQHGRPIDGPFVAVLCSNQPDRYAVHYAVVAGPPVRVPFGRFGVMVVALVVLVTVGSIPLARSLVRPIRELVTAANTFGNGDLTARAPIARTDEIGDLAHAFNAMASNLQAHLLAEKELLANVSHELRTPLARVRVVLETAIENPSRAATLLTEISRDLTALEGLTDDVLATIRLDFSGAAPGSTKIRIRPEPVELVGLVQRAVTRWVEANPTRDVELEAPERLPTIEGDPSLLLRLLDNLLENARKYSSQKVSIRMHAGEEGVVIDVEDQGIGIEPADLERIFEPFFRSDRSRARSSGGTGLGLTLCRRIAEVHGGSVTARSEPGAGTTVTLTLPRPDRGPPAS